MPTTTHKLEIGALCDPISKQLADLISAEDAERLDRDNEAITYAYLRGYMPDATTDRASKKLLARCQEAVTKHASGNTPKASRATRRLRRTVRPYHETTRIHQRHPPP